MRTLLALPLITAVTLSSGCKTANEAYCDEQTPCGAGQRCDRAARVCVDIDAGADARVNPRDSLMDVDGARRDLSPPDGATLQNGQACESGTWCDSGICKDGVCCASNCEGSCRSCAVAGNEGRCELIPNGLDLDGECVGEDACSGACNGEGSCHFPDSSQSCKVASCASGTLTVHSCDGKGSCVAASESCGGYACDAAGTACKTGCTPESGDCTLAFTCIDGACANPQPLGAECGTNGAACASTYCVDGVCCAIASCPVCNACNVDNSGTCAAVAGAPTCGSSTCAAAEKSTPTCNAGACVPVKQSCAPYQCNDAAADCRTSCDTEVHCITSYFCNDSKQCEQKKALGTGCDNDTECESGFCTEGVCCESADCGTCRTCNPGGSCVNVTDGAYPLFCPGDESCGARCESGACAYEAVGFQCAADSCDGPSGVITSFACDAEHLCAAAPTACEGYLRCYGTPPVCRTSCLNHGACVSGSACSIGNNTATGTCTNPAFTTWVAAGVDPNTVLQPGYTIVLKPLRGPYDTISIDVPGAYTIIGWETKPIGGGILKTQIDASTASPAIHVTADVTLHLEGLLLTDSDVGIRWDGSSNSGTIHVHDSEIGNNEYTGVLVTSGSLVMRRCDVVNNAFSGLSLNGASFEIGNVLLMSNGLNATTTHDGAIKADGDQLIISSVTIVDNVGSIMNSGGINWTGGACSVTNAILWNNSYGYGGAGCQFEYTTTDATAPSGVGNNNTDCSLISGQPAAGSACTNSGDNSRAAALDRARNPRIQGGTVDRGASEIE